MAAKKILVVDDEQEIIELVRASIGECFEVVGVTDPKLVQDLAAENDFALAIFDINIGSMTGFDLCKQFKVLKPEVPVVFLSGLDGEQDIIRAYEVGAFDFISKPFKPKALHEKITRLFEFTNQLSRAKESQAASQQVAHDAMSLASRYGMIVSFLDTNVETNDIETLMKSLGETCTGFNLHCAIVCFNAAGAPIYSTASPIEEKFISALKDEGRIVDHHQRTIYSGELVSILVKNMPVDNPGEYGMVKDLFAPLVTGASSRVKSILMQDALASARSQVIDASMVMDEALSNQSEKLTQMIRVYLNDIQSTLMILEMSEEQEQYVLSQADDHMKAIVELVSDQTVTKESLQGIVRNLSGLI